MELEDEKLMGESSLWGFCSWQERLGKESGREGGRSRHSSDR